MCNTVEVQIIKLETSVDDLIQMVALLGKKLFLKKINGWTPRDILAHLIGWNRYMIEGGRQIQKGVLPFYDVDPGIDFNKVNARLVKEYSSTNKSDLTGELLLSAKELTQYLHSLDPADWSRDSGVKRDGFSITIKESVDELIADYAHHTAQIEKAIDNSGS